MLLEVTSSSVDQVILEHNAAGFEEIPKQNVNAQYKHN
jgi:hypothetical protein